VQLPLYNERFVAERLLDAVADLRWPREKLDIQVLDDSTDDTGDIVAARAAYWEGEGVAVTLLRRQQRYGYKAGALAHGLERARGDLIAVFDADFLPPPDFLLRTIPWFNAPDVGMVQARWGFCNAESSLFTRIQALLLEPHFRIEHWVRSRCGLFFNFNGTAGVWRRDAIVAAGGWQSDTVTEDLDLSYRAQLAGWRFVYLDDLEVPSELPVTLAAFRSQQQRWAKGSIQTARKILPRLLTAPLPVAVKLEALAHLLANFCWLLGALVLLTLYPTITWRVGIGPFQLLRYDLPLFLCSSCAILLYFCSYVAFYRERASFLRLLIVPILTMGLASSIMLAVVKGCWSRGGNFERTPKFGLKGRDPLPGLAFLYRQQALPYALFNTLLLLYSLLPVAFAWQRGTWLALPFSLLIVCGFSLMVFMDCRELWRIWVGRRSKRQHA
jgi:cellulose synthase/poly-beta-1,6-N-acetylglucosamine synthase-like glycosyltransferase